VELRSGFLGAHDYKNSPHLLGRREKAAKGFLGNEIILRGTGEAFLDGVSWFVIMCDGFV
jgi:hypothetical protein